MNTQNIRDLLEDLQQQKNLIDETSANLRSLLAHWDKQAGSDELFVPETKPIAELFRTSYIELAVRAIEANGCRPMHINSIVGHIRQTRGNPHIKRRSVDVIFCRYLKNKGEGARIVRVCPGVYGVRGVARGESAA